MGYNDPPKPTSTHFTAVCAVNRVDKFVTSGNATISTKNEVVHLVVRGESLDDLIKRLVNHLKLESDVKVSDDLEMSGNE